METERFDDLAIIIPLRVDSEDRLRNLKIILSYIKNNFSGSEVTVIEQSIRPDSLQLTSAMGINLVHVKDGGAFNKSQNINTVLASTSKPVVCVYDTDMLVPVAAMKQSLTAIRRGRFAFMLPFNRVCVDVEEPLISELGTSLDGERFGYIKAIGKRQPHPAATPRLIVGGILMADRAAFIHVGGMNREMISYGWEDTEILVRAKKLGFYFGFSPYSITHLNHVRGPDSSIGERYLVNKEIFERVCKMSSAELRHYVRETLAKSFPNSPSPRRFSTGPIKFSLLRAMNKVAVEHRTILARFFPRFASQ